MSDKTSPTIEPWMREAAKRINVWNYDELFEQRVATAIAEAYASRELPARCEEVARKIVQSYFPSLEPKPDWVSVQQTSAIIARYVESREKPLREAMESLAGSWCAAANVMSDADGDGPYRETLKNCAIQIRAALAASERKERE
jgi:hypothetical protein